MKTRQHKILDHPIISYFLLLVFALVISELVGNIDGVINHHVLGIESGSDVHLGCGIGAAIGAVVAMGLFKLWFKPDFKGCLQRKGLLTGILLFYQLLSFIILEVLSVGPPSEREASYWRFWWRFLRALLRKQHSVVWALRTI